MLDRLLSLMIPTSTLPSFLQVKRLGFDVADYILTEDIDKKISINFTNTNTTFELLEDFEGTLIQGK